MRAEQKRKLQVPLLGTSLIFLSMISCFVNNKIFRLVLFLGSVRGLGPVLEGDPRVVLHLSRYYFEPIFQNYMSCNFRTGFSLVLMFCLRFAVAAVIWVMLGAAIIVSLIATAYLWYVFAHSIFKIVIF